MSTRTIGRIVGALFLLAFVAYIAGGALVDSGSGEADVLSEVADNQIQLSAGVLLAVGIICLLLLIPLAQEYTDASAGDASVLSSLARVAQEGNHYSFQIAMISVGLGGLIFCRALFLTRLVPRFMAVWGMVGYAVFAAGATLEVLGYGVGLALSVPGGLFEIGLGVLLIVTGFPAAQSRDGEGLAHNVPVAR
ncbi:MAG: DUF4386 family protein [Aeromicrobium sp.]